MHPEKYIPLNPRIRRIQIQTVVRRPVKHVPDHLQNRTGTIPAREINRVIEPPRVPEIIAPEHAVAARRNPRHAMQHLRRTRHIERPRIRRKHRVRHHKRTVIKTDVLHHRRIPPHSVVEEYHRIVHVALRIVPANRRPPRILNVHIAQPALLRRIQKIQRPPVPRTRCRRKPNPARLRPLRNQPSRARHLNARTSIHIHRRPRPDRQGHPARHRQRPRHLPRPARRTPRLTRR